METLRFRTEWEPAPGVSHPAFARTWARLEIAIGDRLVTTVFDHRAGTTRTGVYGPVFVLAEWIAQNYWFLLHECEPSGTPPPSWLRRHSLASGRQGTSLPRLRWFRDEAAVVAEWRSDAQAVGGRPVSFVESGRAELDPRAFRGALVEFVDAALEQLRGVDHPDVAALRADWEAVTTTSGDEAVVCRRAARIGLDAYDQEDVAPELARVLTEGVARLPDATRNDLLDSGVTAGRLAYSVGAVAEAVRAETGCQLVAGSPKGVDFDAAVRPDAPPYEVGYALANALRGRLRQPAEEPFDLRSALEALRWSSVLQPQESWAQLDPNIKGAVGMSPRGAPCLFARPQKATHERFLVSRGMFALLTGATASAPRLLTNAGTRTQAASRAFAAELLAPAAALRKRIGGAFDDERADELAQEFGVAPTVIEYQVENHALGAA